MIRRKLVDRLNEFDVERLGKMIDWGNSPEMSNRLKLFNTKKLNSSHGGMNVTDRAVELLKQFTSKELSLVSEGNSCENQQKFGVFGLEINEDNDLKVLEKDWVIAQVQADLENSPHDFETLRQQIMPIISEAIDRGLFDNWYDVTLT